MTARIVRIDVTNLQIGRLRHEVFSNQKLSVEQRRKAVRRVLPLPGDGSRVDLYCEGKFVGAV
jgi:hypothetical protein